MECLNRTALVVTPRQPYIDWANSTEGPKWDEGESIDKGNVYLIPEFDHEKDTVRYIERNFRQIFEYELEQWMTDESIWPKVRSLRVFREWFDVDVRGMVIDISGKDLWVEDL